MKKFESKVVSIDPYKDLCGRGIRWMLRGESKIRGLIVVREQFDDGSIKETVTYRQEAGMRPIGLQSDGKQSLQLAWDMFHGMKVCTLPTKKGGIYSKGRVTRKGDIIGGTFKWWRVGKELFRSNEPDVTGSRRPYFEAEKYCEYDEARDCLIIENLPEFMRKGSGWVYNTEGVADELSEVRRHGGLKK